MKRVVKTMQEGVSLEGLDGKSLDLEVGKSKELSDADWKNYAESVRKKIGAGTVHYRQVSEKPVMKAAAPQPVVDPAKIQAQAAQAKAQADAKAKAEADEKAKAEADAKAKAAQGNK